MKPRIVNAAACAAMSLVTIGLSLVVAGPARASTVRYYHYEMFAHQSGTHHSYWYKIPAAATISVDSSCGRGGSVVVVDSRGARVWGPHLLSASRQAHYAHSQANRSATEQFITHSAGRCRIEVSAWNTAAPPVPAWVFPDALTTGPHGGRSTYRGPCTITAANTIIASKTVNCASLAVHARNVQIKNSKVNGTVWLDQDLMPDRGSWSMSITDTEVDAGVVAYPAICCGNYSLLRVNAHGGQTGAQCENGAMYCKITDSYLHGQLDGKSMNGVPFHLGGFLNDGGTPSTLTHNTVVCDHRVELEGASNEGGCTGDINLIPNFGIMQNVVVRSNLLGANYDSAYCTYGGEGGGLRAHANHVVYQNNVFQRGSNSRCARYGPVTQFDIHQPGNVWSNNTWSTGGWTAPEN